MGAVGLKAHFGISWKGSAPRLPDSIMKLFRLKLCGFILSTRIKAANLFFFLWDTYLPHGRTPPLTYLIFSVGSLEVLPKAPTFEQWIIKTDNILLSLAMCAVGRDRGLWLRCWK